MEISENEKIKSLRELVDRTAEEIRSGDLSEDKCRQLMAETRQKAAQIVPEDMDKYDLIYASRFERLIEQFVKSRRG
jgi:hypothetical protein